MVRHRILKIVDQNPEYYDFEKYGTPINQLDSMHAICVFCVNTPFVQLPKLGINPDPQMVKEYLAVYRYIAYVLGYSDRILCHYRAGQGYHGKYHVE